jgi:beta-phosphoglucomutase-like phosphatase (HAD superfamily)
VLDVAGLARLFRATVSSEEVARGKPAPDVFLEAARRLGVAPERCAVVEDSANGIRAGRAAGMLVVAIPNPHFPPGDDALAAADVVLDSLEELRPSVFESASSRPGR